MLNVGFVRNIQDHHFIFIAANIDFASCIICVGAIIRNYLCIVAIAHTCIVRSECWICWILNIQYNGTSITVRIGT